MSDQRLITLQPGDANPKDIVLRPLPVADVVRTTIYLYQGDASPNNIILRDPTAAPTAGATTVSATDSASLTLTESGAVTVVGTAVSASDTAALSVTDDAVAVVIAVALPDFGGGGPDPKRRKKKRKPLDDIVTTGEPATPELPVSLPQPLTAKEEQAAADLRRVAQWLRDEQILEAIEADDEEIIMAFLAL